MEVIVTRWYISWSNIWCCCSLSKVVVLSRITTTNRSTVLLLVPTAHLTFMGVHTHLVCSLPKFTSQFGSNTRHIFGFFRPKLPPPWGYTLTFSAASRSSLLSLGQTTGIFSDSFVQNSLHHGRQNYYTCSRDHPTRRYAKYVYYSTGGNSSGCRILIAIGRARPQC
jgi:hypothetical protein